MDIDAFIKIMKGVSEEKFNETIAKGALQLSDEQINTVSFVFWLCYMAETDLESVLTQAWERAGQIVPSDTSGLAKAMLKEMVSGKRDLKLEDALAGLPKETAEKIKAAIAQKYNEKREFDIENLEYFADKIKTYQGMFGANERTRILWKINTIRNDLSHNRIGELKYNEKDLMAREVKEKLLTDYLRTSFNSNFEDTDFYKNLKPEERAEIARLLNQIPPMELNL